MGERKGWVRILFLYLVVLMAAPVPLPGADTTVVRQPTKGNVAHVYYMYTNINVTTTVTGPYEVANLAQLSGHTKISFNETAVVKSGRIVTAWSDNDYKPVPPDSGILSNVWVLNGDDLVRAGLVIGHQ